MRVRRIVSTGKQLSEQNENSNPFLLLRGIGHFSNFGPILHPGQPNEGCHRQSNTKNKWTASSAAQAGYILRSNLLNGTL